MRKGKTLLLLSMLMIFNLVITPTMASRGIPTDAKPVEKESQVADAARSISYRPLNPNKPAFSVPRGRPYIGCSPYYRCPPPP
ncbi:hypothetical protein QJS04_geneDACA005410 [Acorus gramineus]|uniref:Uncharacterized protein n=1 Tax=Acorus gramineus TaxID=55184 RepID=A0AAV9A600_ACOGR|nr:hypothetical protein QJS04_geneDACA005410 [Acorus gramineus]